MVVFRGGGNDGEDNNDDCDDDDDDGKCMELVISVWVTQPEHQKGAKDDVIQV